MVKQIKKIVGRGRRMKDKEPSFTQQLQEASHGAKHFVYSMIIRKGVNELQFAFLMPKEDL